jgi:hypothetical protein
MRTDRMERGMGLIKQCFKLKTNKSSYGVILPIAK